MAQIDDQIHDALTQAIKGGYSMEEALDAIHGGLTQAGAKPEWARSQLAKYGYQPQEEQPGFLDRLKGNLVDPAAQMVGAFSDPTGKGLMDLLGGMWNAQANQGKQAVQAVQGQGPAQGMGLPGRTSEAVGHGLAALLPGMGPMAAQTGEDIGNQNHPAAWGDVLSLAAFKAAENAAQGNVPKSVKGFMADPNAYKPEVGLNKALLPSEGNSGFLDNVQQVGGRVKQAAGRSASNVNELMEDAQKGANQARAALEPYFQRAEQSGLVGLRGDAVVQATQKALDKVLTKPSEAQLKAQIMDETKTDFGRELGLREWKHELENINKQEYGFYNKSTEAQRASLGKVQEAVRKAQRDSMSDMLYKALSPEDDGAGPREIQKSLSGMLDMMDSATNRRRAIGREEAESNLVTGRRVLNQGLHMAAVPLRAVFSDEAVGDPTQAVRGKSNTLIRRSMASIPAETRPYPTPLNPVHPNAPAAAAPRGAAPQPGPGGVAPTPAGLPQGLPPQLAQVVQALIAQAPRP